MSPRTPTLPPTEPLMWRKLLAHAHPDAGGEHELFIWTAAVRDLVCEQLGVSRHRENPAPPRAAYEEPARVPFEPGCSFAELTRRALQRAAAESRYGPVLALLEDCWPNHLIHEQEPGASYKRLAAIAHMVGMTQQERSGWYRVAESIPLSDRHAGHILSRLKGSAAA